MSVPPDFQARWAAAHRLREDGRIEAATATVVALWEDRRTDRAATLSILAFLKECGVQDRALPIARAARQHWRGDARMAAEQGEIALVLGFFDEAADALREAIALDSAQSASWLRLAHCRRFTNGDDSDLQHFRDGWANANLDAVTRTCVGFALGKALDDLGDYAQAAKVLGEANAIARRSSAWRSSDWQRFVEMQRHRPASPALAVDESFVPVFIVGLPRSGTTLIANALARHLQVRDRGELNWVPALHSLLQEQRQLHDPQALRAIAEVIRAQMQRDDAPAHYYIDKNPLNLRYLDFICACFPNAKIVHCRRDSRDTALSIWMQHFAHEDLGFAYDFATIAEVQKGCAALMAHWRSHLPLSMIEIEYERFVAETETQQERLRDFFGLPPPLSGEPEAKQSGIVTTASVWQVRQPVYTSAVERWRRYAPYLPELTTLFSDERG